MATETQTQPSPPDLKVFTRVASIPLVSSSLETIHSTLSSNAWTKSPYSTATELGSSAYKYSTPVQARLAPLLTYADGYANAGLDAVESRYPDAFKTKPEDVQQYVRSRRESASKLVDERVRSPTLSVAKGIDSRFAPIVDYFQVAVNKFGPPGSSEAGPSSPTSEQYQYQRALALSLNLKDQIYHYSNDQVKQLQQQNTLVQRATETAHSIQNLAASSYTNAQARVHGLSDKMLAELQRLQSSLQSSASSAQTKGQAALPHSLQDAYAQLSAALGPVISDLNATVRSDKPLNEKASTIIVQVREGVSPLLGKVGEVVGKGKAQAEEVAAQGEAKAEEAKAAVETKAGEAKANGEAKASEAKANGEAKASDAKVHGEAKAKKAKAKANGTHH